MNLNTVTLTGNLTRDPESFADGKVCKFGLAVGEREKQGDEWGDRTSFFDVTVFGKQAESVQTYMAKGSPVAVSGRLRQDRWEKDGQNRSKVIVIAERVQFLSGGEGESNGKPAAGGIDQPTADDVEPAKPNSIPATAETIAALCICEGDDKNDRCPIKGHGIPF